MESTFGLEIYAANRQFFAGRAKSLIIPAEDGQKEFLAHHANMICAIVPGEMRFEDSEGNWLTVAVSSGFVEMINNRAKLFCLTVERPEEIDIRRAEEARDRAEEQLRQKQSIVEYHRSQAALARAMTRLRVRVRFQGVHKCIITISDEGFGKLCPSSRKIYEKIISI